MSKSNLDEYIKRSEAIEALEDDYNLCFAMDPTIPQDFAYYKVKRAAVRVIARVHPADVKPVVRGKWIDKGESPFCDSEGRMYFNHEYECNHCGFTVRGGELKLCPECGAEMRKEENDGES